MPGKMTPQEREELFERVDVRGPDDCWLWHGAVNGPGYGITYIDGEQFYVHRLVYDFYNGDLGDLQANHHCDITNCVNPKHLYAGDKSENQKDAFERTRDLSEWRAEKHPSSILTNDQAREIKRRLAAGDETHAEIAEDFPVSTSTIGSISAGDIWASVSLEEDIDDAE